MAEFAYISVGYADPRSPMLLPARRDVRSIYLHLTSDGKSVISVFYFNPATQKWGAK